MCLIVFALDCHPAYRLILAANRDEYRTRPTAPATFWETAPHVMGGRDRQAGGTWLGITTGGKLAAVTNYRDARQQVVPSHSRGRLVADYLLDTRLDAKAMHRHLLREGDRYDGFNLLYGTTDRLDYFTNRGGSSGPVPPGVHVLSNHLLDSRWPKAVAAKAGLNELIEQKLVDPEALFSLLADRRPFADGELPDTGIGLERERLLSPLFIGGSDYGTRSTTIVLVDRQGRVDFLERTFKTAGQQPYTTRHFTFAVSNASTP